MNKTSFRKYWSLKRGGYSQLDEFKGICLLDGRDFLDTISQILMSNDRLKHRASVRSRVSMCRFHQGLLLRII